MEIPDDNISDDEIVNIFRSCRRIAVVGMSRDSSKDSHRVAMFLKGMGYEIIPINPKAKYIAGLKSYKSLSEIPREIDIVDVFRPSEEVPTIIEEAIKKRIKVIWLQEGIYHPIVEKIRKYGVKVVWNRCMMREYMRLFK